jgi:heptosyltransferase-2
LDGCDGYPNVVEHDKYIVVCPGAAFGRAKMYPYKHYARVISKLMQSGYVLVMLGAGSDEIVGKEIEKELEKDLLADKNSFINLINKTTLKEACLVLEKARLVISNDSGLMHCSAAFGVWLVAIFGPTDTKHTPPLTKNAVLIERNLDCRPCFKRECYLKHHKCMEDISPNTVIAAVLDILDNKIIGHL